MNHIARMTAERDTARGQLAEAESELAAILAYLATDKFAWPDSDYVHVRTDILPKLQRLRAALGREG
jgi:hypothetical protein